MFIDWWVLWLAINGEISRGRNFEYENVRIPGKIFQMTTKSKTLSEFIVPYLSKKLNQFHLDDKIVTVEILWKFATSALSAGC